MNKDYPVLNFRFEVDGIDVAGFSEISGIESQVEVFTYNEGGLNDRVHNFPQKIKYSNLILKKGMCQNSFLYNWFCKTMTDKIEKRCVSIRLRDLSGKILKSWQCIDAFPVKYSGPQLKALSSEIAFESIELVHSGITLVRG